jgi:energy-coupling factor transporter ATP-binding protein EcfA2
MSRALTLPKDKRLAIVGHTGTGKSRLAHALFVASAGRRRIVIDPFDDPDTTIGPAGKHTPKEQQWPITSSPRIDWRQHDTWRVVPTDPGDLDWYDELYNHSIFNVGDMLVWNDEMGDGTNSHQLPLGIRRVLMQGRKRNISHIACSPRPVEVHPAVWSQSEFWGIFRMTNYDDRSRVAKHSGLPPARFDEIHEQLGPHGFMWWDSVHERRLIVAQGLRLPSLAHTAT